MSETSARYGWQSDLPAFVQASPAAIESALLKFLHSASSQQIISWHDSIRWLQREFDRFVRKRPAAERYHNLFAQELSRDIGLADTIVCLSDMDYVSIAPHSKLKSSCLSYF